MLLASYLLGFDNKDSVKHLAVDNILPEQLDCVEMRLFSHPIILCAYPHFLTMR